MIHTFIRTIACAIGWHDLGRPDWRWAEPGVAWRWVRYCRRCGHEKIIENLGSPPAVFANGKEYVSDGLITPSQREAGVRVTEGL